MELVTLAVWGCKCMFTVFYQTSLCVCSEKEMLKEKRRRRQELFQEQKVSFLRLRGEYGN